MFKLNCKQRSSPRKVGVHGTWAALRREHFLSDTWFDCLSLHFSLQQRLTNAPVLVLSSTSFASCSLYFVTRSFRSMSRSSASLIISIRFFSSSSADNFVLTADCFGLWFEALDGSSLIGFSSLLSRDVLSFNTPSLDGRSVDLDLLLLSLESDLLRSLDSDLLPYFDGCVLVDDLYHYVYDWNGDFDLIHVFSDFGFSSSP